MQLNTSVAASITLLMLAGPVFAQSAGDGQSTARVQFYGDDDATQVVTSIVDTEVQTPADTSVGAHALVDVVSSASVDVVSAATERWTETRVELGARAAAELAEADVSLGYVRSQENDWLSHQVVLGGARELFQNNTVVAASYAFTSNTVGRAFDPNFERSLDSHHAEMSVSQLIDTRTRISAGYTLQRLSGYLASPYRFVIAQDGTRSPELHPDSRLRQAATATLVRALSRNLAGHVSYRLYGDDWGVHAHTVNARLALDVTPDVTVGVGGRGYLQNKANFYRAEYATTYRYMSFDRELATFWDAGAIVDGRGRFGPVVADAKLAVVHYRFDDFPALARRTAWIASAGARVNW